MIEQDQKDQKIRIWGQKINRKNFNKENRRAILKEYEEWCPDCNGTGDDKHTHQLMCQRCKGTGCLDFIEFIVGKKETVLNKNSALERINVKRLTQYISKQLEEIISFCADSELNDHITRNKTKLHVTILLQNIQDRRGLKNFNIDIIDISQYSFTIQIKFTTFKDQDVHMEYIVGRK